MLTQERQQFPIEKPPGRRHCFYILAQGAGGNNEENDVKTTRIEYNRDGTIQIREEEIGDPEPGELQVEGGVCGICSWDLVTIKSRGEFPVPAPPGHEAVGYVRRIGSGVAGYQEGDLVTGGGFATLRNVIAASAYKLPESDIPIEQWMVEPVSCAVTGLDHCKLRIGDKAVIVGCGFMGLLLLQGLKSVCADGVVGIDVAEDRLDLARHFGADETYNLQSVDKEKLIPQLKARGINVVIDTSGSQEGLDFAGDIVKTGGLINLFGWIKGDRADFNPTKWHLGGFTIVNSSPPSRIRDTFPAAIRLIRTGVIKLERLVTHVVDMEEYPSLMERVTSGEKGYIKGVVRLGNG
jgi:threonine dehydrogenase-like Zn-dependent dehydrogenase